MCSGVCTEYLPILFLRCLRSAVKLLATKTVENCPIVYLRSGYSCRLRISSGFEPLKLRADSATTCIKGKNFVSLIDVLSPSKPYVHSFIYLHSLNICSRRFLEVSQRLTWTSAGRYKTQVTGHCFTNTESISNTCKS